MRVLIFSWFFPPYLAAGSTRVGLLAKYLARAGAHVTVIAGRPADLPELTDILTDANVRRPAHFDLNALPRAVFGRGRVHTEGYQLSRLGQLGMLGKVYKQVFHFPDAQIGWLPGALRAAHDLPRPDVILSSSSPATAHIAAMLFARGVGIPWVAEFRDPWIENPTFRRWWPARRFEEVLERRVGRTAEALTGITRGFAKYLSDRFERDVEYIPNGYDPEDYRGSVHVETGSLVHAGTVYTTYPIADFVEGLHKVGRPVRALFLGRNLGDLPRELARVSADRIRALGPVTRSEAIRHMRRAEANVLFFWRPVHPLATAYVPQKLYEYIGARRPILAVGPVHGDTEEVARASGLVTFAATSADVARMLSSPLPERDPDPDALQAYSYPVIAERFLSLFEHVTA